jgi:hypothetical protein
MKRKIEITVFNRKTGITKIVFDENIELPIFGSDEKCNALSDANSIRFMVSKEDLFVALENLFISSDGGVNTFSFSADPCEEIQIMIGSELEAANDLDLPY